jgi:hypothetical protein
MAGENVFLDFPFDRLRLSKPTLGSVSMTISGFLPNDVLTPFVVQSHFVVLGYGIVSPVGRVHGRHRSVTFRKTYRDVNSAKLSGLR